MVNYKLKTTGTYRRGKVFLEEKVAPTRNLSLELKTEDVSSNKVNANQSVTNTDICVTEDQSLGRTDIATENTSSTSTDRVTNKSPKTDNLTMAEKKSIETRSKWKKAAFKGMAAIAKPPTAAETKTSKLRAEMHHKEGTEERIRMMEYKREIDSLKRYVNELKETISSLQKKADNQETKLKEITKNKKFKEDGKEYIIVENIFFQNRLDELTKKTEQHEKVKYENEKLLLSNNKLKMDLEQAEAAVSTFESEKVINDEHTKKINEELEKRKIEIENFSKMYQKNIEEKEIERLEIEKENREMLESLKSKCESSKELENKFKFSEEFVEEQSIALDDLIELVSNLEIEKDNNENELVKIKSEHAELSSNYKTIGDDKSTLEELMHQKEKELKLVKQELDDHIKSNTSSIEMLQQKIGDTDILNKEKEKELESLCKVKYDAEVAHSSALSNLEKEMEITKQNCENIINEKKDMLLQKDVLIADQDQVNKMIQAETRELKITLQHTSQELENTSKGLQEIRKELLKLQTETETSKYSYENTIINLKKELSNETFNTNNLSSNLEIKTKEFLQQSENSKTIFEEQIKMANDEITKKRKQLELFEDNMEQLTAEKMALNLKLEILNGKNEQLIQYKNNLEKKYADETLASLNSLDTARSEWSEKEKEFANEISKYNKDIELYKEQSSVLEKQSKHNEKLLHAQIEKFKNDLNEEINERKYTMKSLENSEKDNEQFSKRIVDLTETTSNLNEIIKNQNSEFKQNMEDTMTKYNDEIEILTTQNAKLQTEVSFQFKIREVENLNQQKEREHQNQLLSTAKNNIEIKNTCIKALNEKLITSGDEIMRLEIENANLKSQLNKQGDSNKIINGNLQTIVNNLTNTSQNADKKILKLEDDIDNLQNNLAKYIQQINNMKSQLDIANQENGNLLSEIALTREDNTETILLLQHENTKYKQEVDNNRKNEEQILSELEAQCQHYQIENKEKLLQIKILDEQYQRVKEKLDRKEDDIKCLRVKHDEELFQHRQKEKVCVEENEEYFLKEITRIQKECRKKIAKLQSETDERNFELDQKLEEKCSTIAIEFEKEKFEEIHAVRDESRKQIQSIIYERDQLLITLRKFESLNLQQKLEHNNKSQDLKDDIHSKKRNISELQAKYNAQHRVIEFIMKSLKNEKSEQNDSKEIVDILNKLNRQFNEKFAKAKILTVPYGSNSDNFSESSSIKNVEHAIDLNATWPLQQSLNVAPSIRRYSYEPSLLSKSSRENVEKTISEINLRLKDLEDFQSSRQTSEASITITDLDESNHIDDDLQAGESAISPNGLDRRNTSIPRYWQTVTQNLTDSGFTESSYKTGYVKSQLEAIYNEFAKLDQECKKVKNEDIHRNIRWLGEVANWKKQMQARLNVIQNGVAESVDGDETNNLEKAFPRCIVFHPNHAEVKEIIDNVNRQYEKLKDFL